MKKATKTNSFSFEVRPSRIDGRGLFATSGVPARRKMGELTGELITVRQARRRARNLRRVQMVEFGDGMALDASASAGGNEFRYVNHSCTPNSYMRLYGHRVEFYALREIKRGEEVSCDYGETHHDGSLACGCGSPKCRGRL